MSINVQITFCVGTKSYPLYCEHCLNLILQNRFITYPMIIFPKHNYRIRPDSCCLCCLLLVPVMTKSQITSTRPSRLTWKSSGPWWAKLPSCLCPIVPRRAHWSLSSRGSRWTLRPVDAHWSPGPWRTLPSLGSWRPFLSLSAWRPSWSFWCKATTAIGSLWSKCGKWALLYNHQLNTRWAFARKNIISLHVKITCHLHVEKITVAMASAFRSQRISKRNGVYVINRTLLRSLVKKFNTRREISYLARPCNTHYTTLPYTYTPVYLKQSRLGTGTLALCKTLEVNSQYI